MLKLAPSILASDFSKLGEEIKRVEDAGVEYLHIDVMDGSFVPSISFGVPIIQAIRKNSNLVFDVHLMIEEPIRYVEEFVKAGADIITVHVESCKHLNRTINRIKELGVKVGVSLNPATPLNVLEYVMEDLDMVLLMSVNPGFGGQKFIPNTIDKLKDLTEMAKKHNVTFDIQVDGGVNLDNVGSVIEAGANVLVAGTAVFGGNVESNVEEFKKVFAKYEEK